jgi:type I restriction enzyme, R subunit
VPKHGRAAGLHPLNLRLPSWLFADPDFDGEPALITEEEMNEAGEQVQVKVVEAEQAEEPEEAEIDERIDRETDSSGPPRKYYVDAGSVEIAAHLVYELDANGKQLRVQRSRR